MTEAKRKLSLALLTSLSFPRDVVDLIEQILVDEGKATIGSDQICANLISPPVGKLLKKNTSIDTYNIINDPDSYEILQ